MGTTKQEMIHLLREMGNKKESVEWFRQRNEELRGILRHISAAAPRMGAGFIPGRAADSVGREVVSREQAERLIEINEKAMERRLAEYAELARVMLEVLTKEEKDVLWTRHAEGLHWDMVAYRTHISRSHCFRVEAVGLEKLCRAWDQRGGKRESEQKESSL